MAGLSVLGLLSFNHHVVLHYTHFRLHDYILAEVLARVMDTASKIITWVLFWPSAARFVKHVGRKEYPSFTYSFWRLLSDSLDGTSPHCPTNIISFIRVDLSSAYFTLLWRACHELTPFVGFRSPGPDPPSSGSNTRSSQTDGQAYYRKSTGGRT